MKKPCGSVDVRQGEQELGPLRVPELRPLVTERLDLQARASTTASFSSGSIVQTE
jgi:hypothetical protein